MKKKSVYPDNWDGFLEFMLPSLLPWILVAAAVVLIGGISYLVLCMFGCSAPNASVWNTRPPRTYFYYDPESDIAWDAITQKNHRHFHCFGMTFVSVYGELPEGVDR